MSRQFKSTDTSKWLEGFGNGGAGSATISGTYDNGTGGYISSFTGTSGQYSLSGPNGWGIGYGGWICLLHQTQGTGAGNWELNRVMSINTTTYSLKYPLQNTYGTGAQIILGVPYKNLTVGNLTATAWNGTTGGIIFLLDQGTTTVGGTITGTGMGFRGGAVISGEKVDGYRAEGTGGAGNTQNLAANGNGGGGGARCALDLGAASNGAGGGGGTAGDNAASGGGNYYTDRTAYGGLAISTSSLTSMSIGGGGGGGGTRFNAPDTGGAGGNGGGMVFIISRNISISGTITNNGANGSDGVGSGHGSGGGGGGGSILLKCQTAILGSSISANRGTGGLGGDSTRAYGGYGAIHLDYTVSYSGSTTPTIDVTQDLTLRQPIKRRMVI
jgi:hypothetical protein